MKTFKFNIEDKFYGIAAESHKEATQYFRDEVSENWETCEEIPESEWDKKTIAVYEDNDFEKEPYYISINKAIIGTEPQMIFTNDISTF